jgi:hypothetical protein
MFPVAAIAVVLVSPADERPVRFEALKDGYRVTLTRPAALKFLDALETTDEESLADTLRDLAKAAKGKDAESETAATLEVVALVLSSQIPQLREAVRENVGPNGATIRVWGLQRDTILKKPRPRLRKVIEGVKAALPDDAKATVDGVLTAARTTPLTWKVEPRK